VQTGQPSHTARGAAAYRAIHQTLEGGIIFSDPFASKILDDASAPALNEIVVNAGQRGLQIVLRPADLILATSAMVVSLQR
jgi:prolyl-tRNA editing enzyme YbaK/EbsC (Cys-tRNA(Pro) deacylase)